MKCHIYVIYGIMNKQKINKVIKNASFEAFFLKE